MALDPEGVGQVIETLRSLLVEAPSVTLWRRIVSVFEPLKGADLEIALNYAIPHLASWPDALREADARWCKTLTTASPDPRLALARKVVFGTREVLKEEAYAHFEVNFARFGLTHINWWGDRAYPQRAFLRSTRLPTLHHLTMGNLDKSTVASAFATSAIGTSLRSLSLVGEGVGLDALRPIFTHNAFPALEELTVSMYDPEPSLALALSNTAATPRLRRLTFLSAGYDDHSLRALVEAPHLARLERLVVRGGGTLHGFVHALSATEALPALQELDMESSRFALGAFAHLKEVGAWVGLRALNLGLSRIYRDDFIYLKELPSTLKRLDLTRVALAPHGFRALARAPIWGGLEELYLNENNLREGLAALDGRRLGRLRALHLENNGIADSALGTILQTAMPRLTDLRLTQNWFTPGGHRALLYGEWPRLRKLHLDNIDDYTLDGILERFSSLDEIVVGVEALSAGALQRITTEPRFSERVRSAAVMELEAR